MTKRIRHAVVLSVITLATAACTREVVVIREPTTTTIESTTTIEQTTTSETYLTVPTTTISYSDDEFYVDFVKSETNLEWQYTDAEILNLGYGFCDMLDQGYTADDIFEAMAQLQVSEGYSEEFLMDIAAAFGSAVPSFCPRYTWMLG